MAKRLNNFGEKRELSQIYSLVSAKVLEVVMPFGPLPILSRKHWNVVAKCPWWALILVLLSIV